jgi:hypothetical protein
MKALIFPIVFLLFLSVPAFATECFQETATATTPCGGLDTGAYANSCGANSNWYDGDWTTGTIGDPCDFYINYTKPNGATGARWDLQYQTPLTNQTIPADCWNSFSDKLVLRSLTRQPDQGLAYCWNVSANNWSQLYYAGIGAVIFKEEGVMWDITEAPATPSVVLWLKFENNYDDSSSFAQTAYPYGDMNFVSGKVGNGLHFDGDFDYLLVNNSESMNFGEGNFTIDVWVRYDSDNLGIFQKYQRIGDDGFGWYAEVQSGEGDEISFTFEGQNSLFTELTPADRYGEWHHRVFMRNGTSCNDIYGFIDGIDAMSKNPQESCRLNVSTPSDLAIGIANWMGEYPPDGTFFDGTLDEFRMWNYALNETEIAALYDYSPEVPPQSPSAMFFANTTKPIVLLLLAIGLGLFVLHRAREGEMDVKTMVGIALTVMIGLAFVMAINGM